MTRVMRVVAAWAPPLGPERRSSPARNLQYAIGKA